MKDGAGTRGCDGEEGQNNNEGFLDHTWEPGNPVKKAGSQGKGQHTALKSSPGARSQVQGTGRDAGDRSAERKSGETRVVVTWLRAWRQNGPWVPMQGDLAAVPDPRSSLALLSPFLAPGSVPPGAAQPGWSGAREEHGEGKSRNPALRYAHRAFTRVKRPYEKEII